MVWQKKDKLLIMMHQVYIIQNKVLQYKKDIVLFVK